MSIKLGPDIDQSVVQRLYYSVCRIRRVEERIATVYPTDKIKSPVHLSIGQESVAVGFCEALDVMDVVFGTYRGHAMYLAKGGDLRAMIAELYGKVTGCARGKGGSMHLVDVSVGVMGTSAVVGTTIPNAVGYAMALKYQQKPGIVISFFGDGAVEEGVFTESLNFAVLKKLPVIFVCENNGYAIHSPQINRQAVNNIADQIRPFNIPVLSLDGNDTISLYGAAIDHIAEMRKNTNYGPVFVECFTSRWREHVGPGEDFQLGYRDKDEVDNWVARDALRQLKDMLNPDYVLEVDDKIEKEIEDAFDFAENSGFPESRELYTDLYKV